MKMTLKNKKLISTLLIILIIPTILFSVPRKADAQFVSNPFVFDIPTEITTAKSLLETILAQVIMAIEKKLLQQLTQSTVNWINSGFHGNPLYVQNPDSFFKDIAKYEVKNLVNMIGYDPLQPFGKSFALNAINAYKAQTADNLQYSLGKVINDPALLDSYRNNFYTGGWNGFLINTQYPQNNYLGYTMLVTDQLARQLAGTTQNAAQKIQTALQQGQGFLSPQTCPSNPNYNNGVNEFRQPTFDETAFNTQWFKDHPTPLACDADCTTRSEQAYKDAYDAAWTAWSNKSYCPGGLVSTTPGLVVANQITSAMSSTFRQSELGAALGNSIGSILDALVNHFLDKGLNGLSNVVNTAPEPDTWSYYGNTLGTYGTNINTGGSGSTTTTPTSTAPVADFNNPSGTPSLSVGFGSVENVMLSHGTAPYAIITQPDATMAVGYISESTLMVSGTGTISGQTSIVVEDSSLPAKTITIPITATADTTSLNQTTPTPSPSCLDANGSPITGVTSQALCLKVHGTWTENTTSTTTTNKILTIQVSGPGAVTDGTNVCSPDNGTCRQIRPDKAVINLNPIAADGGHVFVSWGGDCSSFGQTPTCSVVMSADKNVTAKFK